MPVVVALMIRRRVEEPDKWREAVASERARPSRRLTLAELFAAGTRRDMVVGSLLAFAAVFGLWGATNWTPALVRELLQPRGLEADTMARMVSYAVMMLNVGAIVGYLVFPAVAERLGRRGAFFLFLSGSAVALPLAFWLPNSYTAVLLLLPVLGFFNNGVFSGFPIYLPEIFPTRMRATGAGFCFNFGRVLAASGPFLTGYLVSRLGSYAHAASSVAVVYLLGIGVLWFAPETKGHRIE